MMQDKWIEMKNGRFIGGPKNKKGTTGVWAPVVYGLCDDCRIGSYGSSCV